MPHPCVYAVLVHFRRWTSWHPTRRTTQNNWHKEFISQGFYIFKSAFYICTGHSTFNWHKRSLLFGALLQTPTQKHPPTMNLLNTIYNWWFSDHPWWRPIHYANTIPDSVHSLRFTWYTQCFNTWLCSCLRIIVNLRTDLLWVIPEYCVYEVHLKKQIMSNKETIIHCTLNYSCADYWVCGLSMHDHLVANNY